MRKNRCFRDFVLSLALLLALVSFPTSAVAASSAKAVIPNYTWSLNYQNIDYKNSLYPPLNYKGVTYLPMTWGYCRLLGLSSVWVEGEGLFIACTGQSPYEMPTYRATHNPKTVSVVIPTYPIWLNGKKLDNSREEYPLFNFRGVTYFPMTWRFAHEELNWNTEWSAEKKSFAVHYGIDRPWSCQTGVYEVTDSCAYLVKNMMRNVPIGKNELGDTVYTVENTQKFYTLDYATGKVTESAQRPSYEEWAAGRTDNLPVGQLPEGVSIRNEVQYTDESIPAPYTPFTACGFVTVDGKEYRIGENLHITNVVRTQDFVFCSAKRYTGWKHWTSPNYELYSINLQGGRTAGLKPGDVTRIDNQEVYSDYNSMKLLGYNRENGQLYLKCQQGSNQDWGEGGEMQVSAYNDGYYTMNTWTGAMRLVRRYIYTDQDVLTPDGTIYGIIDWKDSVERLN